MSEWKPISSAPQDGRDVLCWSPWGGIIIAATDGVRNIWYSGGKRIHPPTHYQDLPAPPTDTHG